MFIIYLIFGVVICTKQYLEEESGETTPPRSNERI